MQKQLISCFFVFSFTAIVFYMHYKPTVPVELQKHMTVIIPSYNNKQWYKKNLTSLFTQNYQNYDVIYLDDCSTDNTGKLVREFVHACGQDDRVTIISNQENHGPMYNIYKAVHMCEDKDIIIDYDGDDWFSHQNVLQDINRAYDDPNVWLTYGQYVAYPGGHKGLCKEMPQEVVDTHGYRKAGWFTSHLRTFYAGLFKRIKAEDLQVDGKFYPAAGDQGFMYPLLEMAAGRIKFIDELIYIYNEKNPLNEHKVHRKEQLVCEHEIYKVKKPYEPVSFDDAKQSFLVV